MTLRTGALLITLSLLLNKLSGLYGLLALLTGFHLSPLQLSMYIYSLLALAITAFLAPHIRKQSPLQCLALAWFYVLDSIINAAYTAAFGATWFLVISQHHHSSSLSGPGASTIDDAAGFTSPKYNVSSVEVSSGEGNLAGQDAVVAGTPASAPAGTGSAIDGSPSFSHGVLQPESMHSIGVICSLWTVRIYFVLVMLAYARFVLRHHITSSPSQNPSSANGLIENPFSPHRPEGQGWRGRLGRVLVKLGKRYFLGDEGAESWMYGMGGKFRKSGDREATLNVESGPLERERRRRSGTGPPLPPQQVLMQGQSVKMQDLGEAR